MSDQHLDWEDVIDEAVSDFAGRLHTILPATLVTYDHATQTGTISYDLRTLWVDAETESEEWVPVESVSRVPVIAHPAIVADLEEGTRGLALICERDIDAWKASGAADVTPTDPAKFSRNDAVFLPGVYPGTPNPNAVEDATVLPATDIRLGSSTASDGVVKATPAQDALTAANRRIAALEAQMALVVAAVIKIPAPLTGPEIAALNSAGPLASAAEPPVTGLGSTVTKTE